MPAEPAPLPEAALAAQPETGLFPIRVVAELTGINPVTIRAWERRYQLVRPTRTPGGHRLYSRLDVERLRAAANLVAEGITIGRAARMLAERRVEAESQSAHDRAGHWLDTLLQRLEALDDGAMHAALDAAEAERAGLSTLVIDLLPARGAGLPPLLARFLGSWLEGRVALQAARTRVPGRPQVLFLLPPDMPGANWLLALASTMAPFGLDATAARVSDLADGLEALARADCVAAVTAHAPLAEVLAAETAVPLFSRPGSEHSAALGDAVAPARSILLAALSREAAA
jgi:DNA-binding transcriptional MerR regulator